MQTASASIAKWQIGNEQVVRAQFPGVSCGQCRASSLARALAQWPPVPLDPPAPLVVGPPVVVEVGGTPVVVEVVEPLVVVVVPVVFPVPGMLVVLEPTPTPLVVRPVSPPSPLLLDFELQAAVTTTESAPQISPARRAKFLMGGASSSCHLYRIVAPGYTRSARAFRRREATRRLRAPARSSPIARRSVGPRRGRDGGDPPNRRASARGADRAPSGRARARRDRSSG